VTALNFGCVTAGSKDDLGDFSKDSLQEALGNANLLHERGDYLYLSPLLLVIVFASTPVVCGISERYTLVACCLLHQPLCTAVNRPREQAKDSEVFCTLAASGVEQAKKLAAGAKVLFTVNPVALYFCMHSTNMSHVCVLLMAHLSICTC